ncbi:MAG: excinuclease ABC subunit UvrC [Bacteroidota bacterium]
MVTPEDLKALPDSPGVYLMKDAAGKIIYVGKAISLKNRVRSYFQASRNLSLRIRSMVEQVDRFEYITTSSEVEALVLECNLIKEEHPKYNIRLRDDKQYPWVKVTIKESFPQIFITRKVKRDGSKYYGPYTDVRALKETFRLLRRIFPLRSCRHDLDRERIERPCLNFHIKRCQAPCSGNISKKRYREIIDEVCMFLEGRQTELLVKLRREMEKAASERLYEKAALIRDEIRDIEKVLEKQTIVANVYDDMDVFGIAQDRKGSMVQVFQVRQGKLVGREYFPLTEGDETPPEEILEAFLPQYYDNAGFVPKEVLIPFTLESMVALGQWLSGRRGSKVSLRVPKKGEKADLLRMAQENAGILLKQERAHEEQSIIRITEILNQLQQDLGLDKPPLRIEGFDISNIQGQAAVASMVVFENGVPKGGEYRRFKIRTIEGPNDFAMLQEAVRRRFRKGLEERREVATESGKFARFPDLLLIDGGKGQLSAVSEVLTELGLTHLNVISLAKQEEEIFKTGSNEPLKLSRRSESLMLLQRVRDEAHRFAITYHKTLRDKRTKASSLDLVIGIGTKKKQLLLKHFGSVKQVREATVEELMQVEGINRKLAENIKEQLELL